MGYSGLMEFIPTVEDAHAVISFCKRHQYGENKKESLVDRLNRKLQDYNNVKIERYPKESAKIKQSRKKTAKKTCKIHLGWIHDGIQVSVRQRGGTRNITVMCR